MKILDLRLSMNKIAFLSYYLLLLVYCCILCLQWQFTFTSSKSIKKDSKEEIYCQLPRDTKIEDFGTVPRSRYPLVALLTLADKDDREIYDIVSNFKILEALLLSDLIDGF